jgi:hypothetical protein
MGQGKRRGTQKNMGNWSGNNHHMHISPKEAGIKMSGYHNSCKIENPRKYRARKQRKHKAWLRRHNQRC